MLQDEVGTIVSQYGGAVLCAPGTGWTTAEYQRRFEYLREERDKAVNGILALFAKHQPSQPDFERENLHSILAEHDLESFNLRTNAWITEREYEIKHAELQQRTVDRLSAVLVKIRDYQSKVS